jgi:filamentous hemagglutinin family protein
VLNYIVTSITRQLVCLLSLGGAIATLSPSAFAQNITVDSTLNSAPRTLTGPDYIIRQTDGRTAGHNLFHSFGRFNLETGERAIFESIPAIRTIIARVIGGSRSSIDGALVTQPTVDLFLINPNGIIFGPNASLQVGGSFIASTANSIRFTDGTEFSATNPQSNPLLTISTPLGMQFGLNAGTIINRSQSNGGSPESPVGLQVQNGRTLALLGNGLILEGGILTAPDGQIELGSIADTGTVNFSAVGIAYTFDYRNVRTFGDIQLVQGGVDTSGEGGGTIHLQGGNIALSSFSAISSSTLGAGPGRPLIVDATGTVNVNQSLIATSAEGVGRAGNVLIRAVESVELTGTIPLEAVELSAGLGSQVCAIAPSCAAVVGNGGNLTIITERLLIQNGARIDSSTFGAGNGGNISIRADAIDIVGTNQTGLITSGIFSQVAEDAIANAGNAGNLTIHTQQLTALGGGQVSVATFTGGNAGVLTIHASDFIRLQGASLAARNGKGNSGIFIAAEPGSNGNTGSLSITANRLFIEDRAQISARNFSDGLGSAGNLIITANSVFLDRGRLNAETTAGDGANVRLQNLTLLTMQNQSQISAQAFNNARGGNITIDAASGFVVAGARQNNDIVANAFEGRGGNIDITAQGIIGLEERRSQPTNTTNDIDASSEFGAPGTVTITRAEVDPSQGLAELPAVPITAEPTQGCQVAGGQAAVEFYNTGRGGVAPTPYEPFSSSDILDDVRLPERDLATARATPNSLATSEELPSAIIEAQAWNVDEAGRVVLLAALPEERSHIFCHLR